MPEPKGFPVNPKAPDAAVAFIKAGAPQPVVPRLAQPAGKPQTPQATSGGVQPWCTGPNYVFIGSITSETTKHLTDLKAIKGANNLTKAIKENATGGKAVTTTSGGIYYFGTAAICPEPVIRKAWKPIPSSYRGLSMPSEKAFMGQEATITLLMSRWNETVYTGITSAETSAGPGAFAGSDIGELLMAENMGIVLSIVFPYTAFPAYQGMPKGYRFPMCTLVHEGILEAGGTEGRMLMLGFQASSAYDEKADTWTLYDFNVPKAPSQS